MSATLAQRIKDAKAWRASADAQLGAALDEYQQKATLVYGHAHHEVQGMHNELQDLHNGLNDLAEVVSPLADASAVQSAPAEPAPAEPAQAAVSMPALTHAELVPVKS